MIITSRHGHHSLLLILTWKCIYIFFKSPFDRNGKHEEVLHLTHTCTVYEHVFINIHIPCVSMANSLHLSKTYNNKFLIYSSRSRYPDYLCQILISIHIYFQVLTIFPPSWKTKVSYVYSSYLYRCSYFFHLHLVYKYIYSLLILHFTHESCYIYAILHNRTYIYISPGRVKKEGTTLACCCRQ